MDSSFTSGGSESTNCPRCASSHVVRNGYRCGQQRFLCRGCGRSFGPTTTPNSGGIRLVEKHAAFLKLCHEPLPLRALAQQVGVALSTAFRWRHQYLQRLEHDSQESSVQGCVVVLFTTVTSAEPVHSEEGVSRDTGRLVPSVARFPGLIPKGYSAGTITHLLQCDEKRIVDQISLYASHRPGRNELANIVSEYAAPGTSVLSPLGQGVVSDNPTSRVPGQPWGGSAKVKWLLGGQARRNRSLTDAIADDPAAIRAVAARHQLTFRHWMRTFRGIAVRYIERYLAWFNNSWRQAPTPTLWSYDLCLLTESH